MDFQSHQPQPRKPKSGPAKWWSDFRTNMMYWRFRYVTRNRLLLRAWWSRRRNARAASQYGRAPRGYARPMERGLASRASYGGSRRRSLIAFAALVILLTALSGLAQHVFIAPGIVYGIGSLIVVGCVYYALRGV